MCRVDRRPDFAQIPAIHILRAPIGDHFGRDFQVKLEGVGAGTHPKSLVAAGRGGGQPPGARRQIEGFAVPLKHGFARPRAGKQRIARHLRP